MNHKQNDLIQSHCNIYSRNFIIIHRKVIMIPENLFQVGTIKSDSNYGCEGIGLCGELMYVFEYLSLIVNFTYFLSLFSNR